jgi:hypothetical protein
VTTDTGRSPQGDANAIVLAALAEAYGATPEQATAITDQVLDEYRSTTMDATSAPAVVGRVRELVRVNQ